MTAAPVANKIAACPTPRDFLGILLSKALTRLLGINLRLTRNSSRILISPQRDERAVAQVTSISPFDESDLQTSFGFTHRHSTISNVEKVYFPSSGFTKGQVISFYSEIAEVILPHLRESHTPSWVKRFAVPRSEGGSNVITRGPVSRIGATVIPLRPRHSSFALPLEMPDRVVSEMAKVPRRGKRPIVDPK